MSLQPIRDTAAMLDQVRRQWGGQRDLWVFGYASLIWRPEFDAAEHRPALVRGWHRKSQTSYTEIPGPFDLFDPN